MWLRMYVSPMEAEGLPSAVKNSLSMYACPLVTVEGTDDA